ncbi:GGDEF domain-containing protein [Leptospira sp. 201903070]|uniref:diguanylate cyclase n=1 Tax=Leptospira ainlahdjerensis TaxID=2810033 RepID=A0ABS2U9G7_9LEPT|nr:sensor domain-containing diguanylate cyclase [Leptospira ainlahdjerensis]MBM9577012.1 GGDEF domain-containing protein [Leptospira ainlahdjerensis]
MNYKDEYNLEKFYQYSLDLFSIQRLDGIVISVNPSFERILGWPPEILLGKTPFDLLHPDDVETIQEFAKLDTGIPRASIQNRCRCADGTYKYFAWTGYPDLEAGLVYITGRDITELVESNKKIGELARELKEANDRLFEQASTDPLTNLKNRRAFDEDLNKLIAFSEGKRKFLSLLMIDVDHFKNYNDCFGHPAGDEVLTTISQLLSKSLGGEDVLARYGGEEFIIALPDQNEETAREVAERLVQVVRNFPWDRIPVTISIGIATMQVTREESKKTIDLINEADNALYESKTKGRNRSTHFRSIGGL